MIRRQWFLFGLGFAFSLGFGGSPGLDGLLDIPYLRSVFVFTVMWMTGVTLPPDSLVRSVTQPFAAILSSVLNMVGVPLLCWFARYLLPPSLGGGLYVAGLVPCTLASAAIWTRKAGGDDSVALLTTVVTNLSCVLVVPAGVWIGLGHATGIPLVDQVGKLLLIIVFPLVLAQASRRMGLADWADRSKPWLSQLAQSGILVMVFFGAIASRRLLPDQIDGAVIGSAVFGLGNLVLSAMVVHVAILWLGIRLSRAAGVERDRQIAVGFASSQKTLMVGLQIAMDCGVSVVPMIVYHLSQLLIDTYVAGHWAAESRGRRNTSSARPGTGPA